MTTDARPFFQVLVLVLLSSCGGSSPPAESASEHAAPPAEATKSAEASQANSGTEPAPSGAESPAKTEAKGAQAGEPASEAAQGSQATAPITKYRITDKGLLIDMTGVHFVATVKPVRVEAGWGVEVDLQGEARDDKEHNLLSPKSGPLAFGGEVKRKGQSARFGDKRSEDSNLTLGPNKPLKTTRTWPGTTGEKPLSAGDELKLEVGLWGLGDTPETRKRVREFFIVRMTAGKQKPLPVIEPPASAGGG
ncbi:MAG TPA: hypothetical protein VGJ84_22555 [Polyangiaceae bacterium]|jgi:hypothetical protein